MNYAPVVMFVYNRADHFKETYMALTKCPEAKYTDLFIFSDNAKNEKAHEGVAEVRSFAHKVENAGHFKSVAIIESVENQGLARSVINGVTQVVNDYGKVIVVEDDCVCSPYFLGYMNKCLDYYKDNKKIGVISGYAPRLDFPVDYNEDVFTAYRSCSCTWGTWADRWSGIDWDLKGFADFCKNPSLIKKLNSNGNDRFMRLYRQTKGNGSSWSVRFGAHLVKNDWLTIYPRYSYIQNIGCDESGVHSKSEDAEKMAVDLTKAIKDPDIKDVELNKKIQKIMKKHYSYGFISDIKKFIATALIVAKCRLKG